MRFLADESVERKVVEKLREEGFEVISVADIVAGLPDEAVLALARQKQAVLITADKDFGELVYRRGALHEGVVLIRLGDLPSEQKAETVCQVVKCYGSALKNAFAVISETGVRIRQPIR
jgi:predicted nuclease of predicted toxin-antitoxin system